MKDIEKEFDKILYPLIAKELNAMREVDQEVRFRPESEQKAVDMKRIDESHTARLKEIVSEIGWPTISKVGPLASKNAWLLTQHADLDRGFQAYCLKLMNDQPEWEVSKIDIAYLTDRLLVASELPQRYGTQFYPLTDEQNNPIKYYLRAIEDPEYLEIRRAEMDLEPFTETLEGFANLIGLNPEDINLSNFEPFIKKS